MGRKGNRVTEDDGLREEGELMEEVEVRMVDGERKVEDAEVRMVVAKRVVEDLKWRMVVAKRMVEGM